MAHKQDRQPRQATPEELKDIEKLGRELSKRERKESIKNARKRQEFFGYRNV